MKKKLLRKKLKKIHLKQFGKKINLNSKLRSFCKIIFTLTLTKALISLNLINFYSYCKFILKPFSFWLVVVAKK